MDSSKSTTDPALKLEDLRTCRITVPSHVVSKAFAAETVLLNINTGMYHGMDTVGCRFFETISVATSLAAAAESLAAEFEQPHELIAQDLLQYCSELCALGLFELHRR